MFGNYVDELKTLMGKAMESMPIVVVQFAKVKIVRGKRFKEEKWFIAFCLCDEEHR